MTEPLVLPKLHNIKVKVETFEGPLDLLMTLIQKREMDIFSVNLGEITSDYLAVIQAMQDHDLDMAGEYLVVASSLVRMKSRSLLPPDTDITVEDDDEDPELMQIRVAEYARFKEVAKILKEQEQMRMVIHTRPLDKALLEGGPEVELFEIDLFDLYQAFKKIMLEIGQKELPTIAGEEFTVDEKMAEISELLEVNSRFNLSDYLRSLRSKLEIITTFLALLELLKQKAIKAMQSKVYGDIWITKTEVSIA